MTCVLLAGDVGFVAPERKPLEDALGTRKPETQGPTPAPPLLECVLSKDVDLTPVLPWTAAESNEHGRTLIWPGARAKRPTSKAVYPFFLHSVFAGLVPPFSSFFTAILNHYGIHALHLQPNSILLLSIFAFYREAFVGVRPSVALFHHFFSLRLHDSAHLLACVSFVAAQSDNLLLKAGKKVENFRQCWVLMSLKDANLRLEEPKVLPEKTSVWISAKLSDPRAVPILERFSRNISAKRLTGGMIVKEFLAQRLAPLQAYSTPMWDYQLGDEKLRLWSQVLPIEELNRVTTILLGGDPGDLPDALGPLYYLDDRANLITALPAFDERGLLPAEGSGPVEVSSDDTSGGGGGDSDKTVDDCPTSAPLPSQAVLLHDLEDDDATSEVSSVLALGSMGLSRRWSILPPLAGSPRHRARPLHGGPVAPAIAGAERKRRWVDVEE
ncbi:hypothetical protein ZWY2020_033409 [Hordeum vulgare]|nr:hypothetical protein ZWY2020_033409 [Hordeum vulgare]